MTAVLTGPRRRPRMLRPATSPRATCKRPTAIAPNCVAAQERGRSPIRSRFEVQVDGETATRMVVSRRRALRRRRGRGRAGRATDLEGAGASTRCSRTSRPAHEPSARDLLDRRPRPATGELGVAVQSHWFSVGSIVTWARAGVGAVATQSIAEPAYGPRLLDRLGGRREPERGARRRARRRRARALPPGRRRRCRRARSPRTPATAASPTPATCAGDGFSAQANMMASPEVWPAMAAAFEAADGQLARRLLAALEARRRPAATFAGASRRRIAGRAREGERWETRVELRVEDSPIRSPSCAACSTLSDAYALADRADELAGEGDHERGRPGLRRGRGGGAREARARLLGGARDRRRRRPRGRRRAGRRGDRRGPGLGRAARPPRARDRARGGGGPRGASGSPRTP